jgi:hypothetical protein
MARPVPKVRVTKRLWLILSGIGVLVLGTSSGVALGSFATGGTARASASEKYLAEAMVDDAATSRAVPPVQTVAIDDSPDHYVCHGCGPSISERQMETYTGVHSDGAYDAAYDVAKDLTPLPAYRPVPYDGDEPVTLPTL